MIVMGLELGSKVVVIDDGEVLGTGKVLVLPCREWPYLPDDLVTISSLHGKIVNEAIHKVINGRERRVVELPVKYIGFDNFYKECEELI